MFFFKKVVFLLEGYKLQGVSVKNIFLLLFSHLKYFFPLLGNEAFTSFNFCKVLFIIYKICFSLTL